MYVMRAYDDALELILKQGVRKTNRTGVDTIAICGIQSRYRIDEFFPFLTGRKIPFKAMVGELLWFVSGSTNNEDLKKLGCNFWNPWVDEEFEVKHGYAPGSFGPVYGFQLRHFGGVYGEGLLGSKGYGDEGFDQLDWMVKCLKTNPDSRRIIFSLWNPKQTHKMKLPPCHYTFQCFAHDGKLSGMLTQRSCDFPIGVPFNIAFYSALVYMLAQQTGLEPYEFIHSTVDSHIYANQTDAVEEYLSRPKPDSPRLKLTRATDMFAYSPKDFELEGYNPQPGIKISVAV